MLSLFTESPGGRQLKHRSAYHLTVDSSAPADPYLAWAGEDVLFGDDANEDGISNGLAFLLGAGSPTSADALGLLPSVSKGTGNLTLDFSMRNATVRGSTSLAIEYGTSLETGSWTTVPVPDTEGETVDGNVTFDVGLGSPLNTVTATISADVAEGGKLFARLKATE